MVEETRESLLARAGFTGGSPLQVHYHVEGGHPLRGSVLIQGAKNAALPMIASSLLASRGKTVLHNLPLISDVYVAIAIAAAVGAKIDLYEAERVLVIDASSLTGNTLPGELTRLIRGSILFMPPLFVRTGAVTLEEVGGCNLGERGLDFHYRGFARLGAHVDDRGDRISVDNNGLRGAPVYLDTPSHTGTENLIAAACLAKGSTVIENAALEPEIADYCGFLTAMGAHISGVGTGTISVAGVKELSGIEYTIMPDRIDAGAMVSACAATGGSIELVGANLAHLGVAGHKLEQMGVHFDTNGPVIRVQRPRALRPVNVITWPYPGFATDLQPMVMALSCLASGTSYVRESIFEQRFAVAGELNKLGAGISVADNLAVVRGPRQLTGAEVSASDLRAGMALIIAGLAAEGTTLIASGHMVERGHSALARRLSELGACISRASPESST